MKKFLVIIAAGLGIQPAFAQSINQSYSPNLFNVRAYSYAGAYSAAVNEASALYYNPGALGTLRKFSMNLSTYLQFNTSSFDIDDKPSGISSGEIEERSTYIRPDFAGITFPIGESGFTVGAAYMRMFDQSYTEKWTIKKSNAADETVEFDLNTGIHNVGFGFGKAFFDEDNELQFGLGSTVNFLFGSSDNLITQNGANVVNNSGNYSGLMFRHGMVLKSEEVGLSLVYESPWQRNKETYDLTINDSIYSIVDFAPMMSIGGYAGGDAFRFHIQYDHRFSQKQEIYEGLNGTDYMRTTTYTSEQPMNSIALSLESGTPNESGIRYSFKYSNYPIQIDGEKVISYMGVFGAGGSIGGINDLILDVVIGLEYFPRHFGLDYGNAGTYIHEATFWRIGLSLSHRGFSQF